MYYGHPLCSEGVEGLDKKVVRDTNWVVETVQRAREEDERFKGCAEKRVI